MANRSFPIAVSRHDLPVGLFPALLVAHVAGRLTGMRWLAGLAGGLMPVAAATAVTAGVIALRRARGTGLGSQTNASEAMDTAQLGSNPSSEDVLDAGVEYTFPASDPISVQSAYTEADKREERERRGH